MSKLSIDLNLVTDALGSQGLQPSELDAFASALQQKFHSVCRFRSDVTSSESPFASQPVDWYASAYRSDPSTRPSRDLTYAAGDFYLQDAGSLLALAACQADRIDFASQFDLPDDDLDSELSQFSSKNGPLVCDLCASPGGKATALLEAIGDAGFLLANEPIRGRIAPLLFNLARTGSDRFAISSQDPEKLSQTLGGVFDLVLVDAPCSGQALLGRGKQSQSALSTKQIELNAARQSRIMQAAIGLLRPAGRLVYSTCTFATAENESQIEQLIAKGLAEPHEVDRLSGYQTDAACYRLWPHRHACAGSFAASLVATHGEPESDAWRRIARMLKKKLRLPKVDLPTWYDNADAVRLKASDAVLYGWPQDVPEWVESIADFGPELAHRTGQVWKPAHAGGIRRCSDTAASRTIDVDDDVAIRFMTGEPIDCDTDGWQSVRWQQRPLGWIKASRGVGKNHVPSAARFPAGLTRTSKT